MKRYLLLILFPIFCLPASKVLSQNGFIYVHLKSINEEQSATFSYVLRNSSTGLIVRSFPLNDQATSDNVALSGNKFNVYDLGLSHGTGGDGQLWAVVGTTADILNTNATLTGSVYVRDANSSSWKSTGITGVRNIDGAYANQFVYISSGNVLFYNNGSTSTIYTGGDAWDVTANAGKIAITTSAVGAYKILLYSNTYTTSAAPATGGTWATLATPTYLARIDMDATGANVATMQIDDNAVYTTTTSSPASTYLGKAGIIPTGIRIHDVAYDDNGVIYAPGRDLATGQDEIFHYTGSSWVAEAQSRQYSTITGGAAHLVYAVNMYNNLSDLQSIMSRQVDNLGNIYWIDDERVKTTQTNWGNSLIISVPPGTYTLTEAFPSTTQYDLGRYNIYDANNGTTGDVNNNKVTFNVTAGNVSFVEFVNEILIPKSIPLNCSPSFLQTFDADNSSPAYTYKYGTGTYGAPIEGTAYHYATGAPDDGYYYVIKSQSSWVVPGGISDHTGNGGYFLLVNAAYSKDEFYRQRVTNLVPGVSYTISFYAANISPGHPVVPNVTYGLQDTAGTIVNSASTGNITTTNTWTLYSFTFTATTSRADLFLRNNTIGGDGNDIAIDDISINPVIPTLPPSSGSSTICIGSSYTFTNSQSGGVWTSSNPTVATINPTTGAVNGKAAGQAIFSYSYTNAIGCIGAVTNTVTVAASPVITVTDKQGGSICQNQQDSLFTNFITESTAPYTYKWTVIPTGGATLTSTNTQNTSTTATIANKYIYTSTVTDAVGCIVRASLPITVVAHSAPTVVAANNSVGCLGSTFNLTSAVTGGTAPFNYLWSGTPTGNGLGVTNTQNTTATPTANGTYTYTVNVSDAFCSNVTASTTVNMGVVVTASNFASSQCTNTLDSVFATASGGNGALTYLWSSSPANATYSPNNTSARAGVSLSTLGLYTFNVLVTDSRGCTGSASTSIYYFGHTGPVIGAVNTAQTTCANTAINLAGTGITAIANGTVISSNPAGTPYGFPASLAFDGNVFSFYDDGATTSPWVGLDLGTATQLKKFEFWPRIGYESRMVGGVFQGSNDASFNTGVVTLATIATQPADEFATLTSSNITTAFRYVRYLGPAGSNGNIAEFHVYTEYSSYNSYAWSASPSAGSGLGTANTPSTTATPTMAGAYNYTLKVTDLYGCAAQATTGAQTINASPAVLVSSARPVFCSTTATNQLFATASGGSGSYSYSWATAVSTAPGTTSLSSTSINNPIASISGAAIGSAFKYTATVTDGNNCAATASTTDIVVASTPAVTSITAIPANLCFNAGVSLSAAFSGGTAPYNYIWTAPSNSTVAKASGNTSTSPVTTTATTAAAQNYSYGFFIVDTNSCSASGNSAVFTINATPVITLQADKYSVCANPSSTINLTGTLTTEGTAPYTYAWTGSGVVNNTSSSTTTAVPTASGVYTVKVTDANGCNSSASSPAVSVDNASPAITFSCNSNSFQLYEQNGVSWTWTTTSGGRFYTSSSYSVNTDSTTSHLQAPYILKIGSYSVQITKANGCIGSGSVNVTTATCNGVLADNGLAVAAEKKGNDVNITWKVVSDVNTSTYFIERSTDAVNFSIAGSLTAKAGTNNSYSYVDNIGTVSCVKLYYRIKKVDNNNGTMFSNVVPVACNGGAGQYVLSVYPNPVTANGNLLLSYSAPAEVTRLYVVATNAIGNVVYRSPLYPGAGTNNTSIILGGNVSSGTYFIRLVSDKWMSSAIKIVKQ